MRDVDPGMQPILSFKNEHAFLSNFYPSEFRVAGKLYTTVEHYYQACKMVTEEYHEHVRTAVSPGRAKRLGRVCPCRSDWEQVKEDVMYFALRLKFLDPHLRKKLLATSNAYIIEGNTWGDRFWGQCKGKGENKLGKLLMQLRADIRDGKE